MVSDFGIAKALGASRTQVSGRGGTLTQAGTSLGTPAYMAPEQALGDATDARANLYAWGVIAYELVAGVHPFPAHATAQRLIAAHLTETPASSCTVQPGVPAELAALVAQCLAKDPADRPRSANEVLARLSEVTTSSAPTPSGSSPRAARPTVRRWVAAAAAVMLVLLAVAAAIVRREAAPLVLARGLTLPAPRPRAAGTHLEPCPADARSDSRLACQ